MYINLGYSGFIAATNGKESLVEIGGKGKIYEFDVIFCNRKKFLSTNFFWWFLSFWPNDEQKITQ